MKMIAYIFTLFLSLFSMRDQPLPTDLEDAIKVADFVGFVVYKKDGSNASDYLMLGVTESFKGDVKHLVFRKHEAQFLEGYDYLVIASKDNGVIMNFLFPISMVEDLSPAAMKILNNLECYSETLAKKYQSGICTRELDPVCGCDNKTYGNLCEMSKAGIMKFKPGRCQ